MIAPEFLDLEEVLEIHALQLAEFGGIAGVRDRGLLESPNALRQSVTREGGAGHRSSSCVRP